MMKKSRLLLFSLWTLVLFPESLSQAHQGSPDIPLNHFPNVNSIYYYQDPEALKSIKDLEEASNNRALYSALSAYVSNFGIGNFKKEIHLVLKLAKLNALMGNTGTAEKLYDLVLRHYSMNEICAEILPYKDSLSNALSSQYVSLRAYYDLIERSGSIDTVRPHHGEFKNLGHAINSSSADYAPAYSSENHTLVFTSQRHTRNSSFGRQGDVNEDLFISKKDSTGNWTKAEGLDKINTKYNEGSGCLSADGKTMYFSRCNSPDSYGNCDLFVAYLQEDSTWGKVKNLGPKVNSVLWDSHPSLSHTEDTLYFSSDRKGGFGQSDIYFTFRDSLGEWTTPQNMGPVINTRFHDVSPFYHPVYDVLYFSSSGQPFSFGEFDIYKTTKKNGHWSCPDNVGPIVNHSGSETYFTLDPETNLMFFARSLNHNLGRQDLYSFPLPMEAYPNATTTLSGTLTDSTGAPLAGIISLIDLKDGTEIAPKYLAEDGSFEFNLIDDRPYAIAIRGKNYFRIEDRIVLHGPTTIKKQATPLSNHVTFASINFDFDSASLKPKMYPDLNKVVKFMNDNPEFNLKIAGHTDSEGSDEYNLDLSIRRARSLYQYILNAGIDESRIHYVGYGNTQPVARETSKKHKAINRRVEFIFYQKDHSIGENTIRSITKT